MPTNNTIRLLSDSYLKEAEAAAAITPGHVLERVSTGKVQKHSSAGGNAAPRLVAVEDDLQGNDLTDDYASGDRARFIACRPGDEMLLILKDGESVVIGDKLESAGNGEVQKHTADSAGVVEYPEAIVGIALEAVDASDSATTPVASRRIRVEMA